MYSDNTKFSIKNMIIQFLFVALFIFILIWLFPLKSDLKNLEVTTTSNNSDTNTNEVLYDRIFNENILSMKESAKSYYTTSRLPQNVNDKVKMTLGEMLEKKIILPFVDKNGNACNLTDSYVEITKYDEEFVMKVNLKCGEQENYLLVYMGCYDYCETAICEKNQKDITTPTIYSGKAVQTVKQETKPTQVVNNYNNVVNNVINNITNNVTTNITNNYYEKDPEPTPEEPTPEKPTPEVEYLYEYSKTTNGTWKETDWSEWSTTAVSASSTRAVQIKTVTQKVLKGYNVTKGPDYDKPIYGTKEVVYGTKEEKYCSSWGYVKTGNYTYSDWKDAGLVTLYYVPTSTETVKYEYVRSGNESCTSNCTSTTYRIYRKYTRTKIAEQEYKCLSEATRTVELKTTVKVITGYEQKIISKEPVYETVVTKYYRYKTREYVGGTTDTKWSFYNDTSLLNAGYSYTGNKKVK